MEVNMFKERSELTAINLVNAVLAALLFVSPWLFGFAGQSTASWNAWAAGLVIGIVALVAIADVREWQEWVNLALGLWVAASPWLLGFAGVASAMWTHVLIGLGVAILAAVELWMLHKGPTARTA
jgi:hypothetical protein